MIYILITFLLFVIFKVFQANIDFKQKKQRLEYELLKVDKALDINPNNSRLLCRKASIYQEMQNFPQAIKYYETALSFLQSDKEKEEKEFLSDILKSITYNRRPLPWSNKQVQDKSNSSFTYFLIVRFGNTRSIF